MESQDKRGTTCKVTSPVTVRSSRIEEWKTTMTNQSLLRSEGMKNGEKLTRLVRGLPREKKKERAKFSMSLSKKEINEDSMELLGHKPFRRPKKMPRIVQKQLDVSQSSPSIFQPNLLVFCFGSSRLKFFSFLVFRL